jgi:TRAP-type mannitol/chloroaromatic compound transport system substrate-binding protein
MSFLNALKLVEFKPQHASGAVFVRRRKLADKIAQQINLASDAAYAPTKIVTVKDENGNEQRREVAKRIKRWWVTNADGSVQLTVRYGSKPIEFAKGKNAIELSSASEIAPTLTAISDAVMNGELDAALAVSSAFGRKLKKGAA